MGSRIDDAVGRVALGAEGGGFGVVAKSKLKDSHSWIAKGVPQGIDVRCNHSEILGNDGKGTEGFLCCTKKFLTWSRRPVSMNSGGFFRGNFPVGGKAAEVVDPNNIVEFKRAAESFDPPSEAIFLMNVPTIKRIAPALTCSAEVVWGDTGDCGGMAVFF
jgi:hypothetical protein